VTQEPNHESSTIDHRSEDAEFAIAVAYAEVAGTRAGKVMIADLESKFGCNPFDPDRPHNTSFHCGSLRVLQEIGEQLRRAEQGSQQKTGDNHG
jgi:hypothetical protein